MLCKADRAQICSDATPAIKNKFLGSVSLQREEIVRMWSMGVVCRDGGEAIQENT